MVCINYNCYALRRITKTNSENIVFSDKTTLANIFNILIDKYGALFKLNLFAPDTGRLKIIILVNGISTDDHSLNIAENDKINLVSPIVGG